MGRKANPDCPCRHEGPTTCPCQTVWPDSDLDMELDTPTMDDLLYTKEEVVSKIYH